MLTRETMKCLPSGENIAKRCPYFVDDADGKSDVPTVWSVFQVSRWLTFPVGRVFWKKEDVQFLCRTASNIRMAALTLTFSESIAPSMGMRMWAFAACRHASVSPVASVPITMAVGAVMSVS